MEYTVKITKALLDSFEFTGCGWVDDGYNGALADAIIRAMGIAGVCTMWKKGKSHDYFIAWSLDIDGREYAGSYDYLDIAKRVKNVTFMANML